MGRSGQHWLYAASVLVLAGLPVGAARAQAVQGAAQLEELVVTAQRREQNLQSVGIAIAAYGSETLRRLGVTSSVDIATITPGVTATGAQGGFLQTFSIRGVTMGDYLPHQEGPIAVYRDEVYVSSLQAQSFATFDSERIEVLKGPQGTLFGRNATGGLVSYITKKPTQEFSGSASATYGSFDEKRLEAGVGAPLGEKVGVRLAGLYHKYDPVLRNSVAPDYHDLETRAARLHVALDPVDNLRILISGQVGKSDFSISGANQFLPAIAILDGQGRQINSRTLLPNETASYIVNGVPVKDPACPRPVAGGDCFGYVDPDGIGRFSDDSMIDAPVSNTLFQDKDRNWVKAYSGTLNVEYDFAGGMRFVSITDYSHYDWRIGSNIIGGPGKLLGVDTWTDGIRQVSQELRLAGDSGPLNWVVGGYYLSVNSKNGSSYGFLFGAGDQVFRYSQETDSYSLFAQAEYKLTPELTLIAGARHIWEEKEFDFRTVFLPAPTFTPIPLRAFNSSTSPLASNSEKLWSVKLGVNYEPADDVLLYATFNRGVKAGGFNAPTVPATPDIGFVFDPETLLAYEAGFKLSFAGGAGRLNGSGFYYDYSNYQAFQNLGPGINVVINADARVYGGELEVEFNPVERLSTRFGAAYTDALVKDVEISPGINLDRRPAFAPKWQLSSLLRYDIPVRGDLNLGLQADANYRSSYFFQLANFDALRQRGYALLNLRASLSSTTGWRLEAAVKNVTDKIYGVSNFDMAQAFGNQIISFDRGRLYQLTLSYDW